MSWRSNDDGTHFPINKGIPSIESLSSLQQQDTNRTRQSRKISVAQRLKAPQKVKEMRIQAFLHHFSKVADPYGLQWLIATGRSDYEVERKLADIFGYNSFPQKDLMWFFGNERWTYKPNPKVINDMELKGYAEELAGWLKNRYPLYQPRKRDLEE